MIPTLAGQLKKSLDRSVSFADGNWYVEKQVVFHKS